MLLRFFIVCTLFSICVTAHPSRLKILPGLAFYRTEDTHDEQDNSLMDKDKDLLRSMWNIVDKMDYKTQQGEPFDSSPSPTISQEHVMESFRKYNSGLPSTAPPSHKPGGVQTITQNGHGPLHGAPGKIPPLGTPITTINVYSTYPAAAVKPGGNQFAATAYHHVPPYHNGNPPFASTHNQNMIPQTGPHFEAPKPYNPIFDPPAQDNLMPQPQYDSGMNTMGGMGQSFDTFMDQERGDVMGRSGFNEFNAMNQDNMGQFGMGGMENQGSELMPYMMPQGGEDRSYDMMRDMNMGNMGAGNSRTPYEFINV